MKKKGLIVSIFSAGYIIFFSFLIVLNYTIIDNLFRVFILLVVNIIIAILSIRVSMAEEYYRKAYKRAEFYKDLFTHDIRNIFQNFLSGTQLNEIYIDNPEKLEKSKEINRIIKDQVRRGAKLISNIQKLSKLEESELFTQKIEFCNILEKSITFVKNAYQHRDIIIQIDSVGEKLYAQANYFLESVFENILINAIRYNENPSVEINIKISKVQKKGANYLKMEFLDNGIGIEDNRKEKIFQRGYNEDKSIHGMGLGLSLVKRIIETYNGKIWVEDRVKGDYSKGTNFIIFIPEVV